MQNFKKKTNIIFIILYAVLMTFVVTFYLFFTSTFNDNFNNEYINKFQNRLNLEITENIKSLREEFLLDLESKNIEELNNNLKEDFYLGYYAIKNNKFNFLGHNVDLSNNYLKDNKLGFSSNYFYIYSDEIALVLDANSFFDNVFSLTDAFDVIIMSSQGEIYLSKKKNGNVLSSYVDIETKKYIDGEFKRNESIVIRGNVDGVSAVINFTPLSNLSKIYIGQTYEKKVLVDLYSTSSIFFIILILTFTFVTFGILSYVYYQVNIRNSDIEGKKLLYYYNKSYIIKINDNGKVKALNNKFKEVVLDYKELKSINDFKVFSKINEEVNLETVKRGNSFTVIFKNTSINFIPIKIRKGYYLIGKDISEEEKDSKEVEFLACYDSETLFANKYMFLKEYEKIVKSNSFSDISVLVFNVNNFRNINKTFSHKVGTELLINFGKLLEEVILKHNLDGLIYNAVDDVFTVIIKNSAKDKTEKFVLEVIKSLEKPFSVLKNNIIVTVSVGIFYVTNEYLSLGAKEVYNNAYEAMMKAREKTLTSYVVYDNDLKQYVSRRNQMEKDLIKAIEKKEFIVYLQPQYSNKEERIIGFEALVRWDNPNYIKKSPQEFIELAEENSLIVEIGRIIMEKTFEIARKLKGKDISISMNISPVQMLQQGFVDEFMKSFKKYELQKGSISVEVTETFLMNSFELVNEKLNILKKEGIDIHLDDFGTGYSSLPYLKDLNFDAIKIDKTFITHITTDKYHRAIVNMILNLAKNLELEIIAEGVEDIKQNQYLYKNGCNIIQGYLVSKPVSFKDALVLIEEYNDKKIKTIDNGVKK